MSSKGGPSKDSRSIDYEKTGLVLTYEKAIKRTIGPRGNMGCSRYFFQILVIFVALMTLNSCNFLILGLPFMKKMPEHYHCRDVDSGEWKPCSK